MKICPWSVPSGAPVSGLHNSEQLNQPGRLVLVVGPSGAGKDTILNYAKAELRSRTDIIFVRRIITRAPDLTEDHEVVSIEEFERRRAVGQFALYWHAHETFYALPNTINRDIADGQTIIANVSRSVISTARSMYRTTVIAIDADIDIRAARIMQRGREIGATITARIQRPNIAVTADAVIINNTEIADAGRSLVGWLTA